MRKAFLVAVLLVGAGFLAGCYNKANLTIPDRFVIAEEPPPVPPADSNDPAVLRRENVQLRQRMAYIEQQNGELKKDIQDLKKELDKTKKQRDHYKKALGD